ncbi:MAG TPA: hypothetical protein VFH62_08610 [Dehalococcoidia bacterium]|jgi:hypothetical protein|nr:hypothetical protein [Dehalococcoidia bacterium]
MDTNQAEHIGQREPEYSDELPEEFGARLVQRDRILRELNDALDRDLEALLEPDRAAA